MSGVCPATEGQLETPVAVVIVGKVGVGVDEEVVVEGSGAFHRLLVQAAKEMMMVAKESN